MQLFSVLMILILFSLVKKGKIPILTHEDRESHLAFHEKSVTNYVILYMAEALTCINKHKHTYVYC